MQEKDFGLAALISPLFKISARGTAEGDGGITGATTIRVIRSDLNLAQQKSRIDVQLLVGRF